MSLTLLETIAVVCGTLQNLTYHQQRYAQGLQFLAQQTQQQVPIRSLTQRIILPEVVKQSSSTIWRCRVEYGLEHEEIQFYPYVSPKIHSFQCVHVDDLDYQYKYANRTALNQLFAQRGNCDEIIIIKNQRITDCSIGNLLFFKEGEWYTPEYPLLAGTQRAKLLTEQRIKTAEIYQDQIMEYQKIMLINALNPFDESRAMTINSKTIQY